MTAEQAENAVYRIARDHFPEIDSGRLRISFAKKKDYYMALIWHLYYYRLSIDAQALKFSDLAFGGCVAHELSHILILKRLGFFARIKQWKSRDSASEERAADLLAMERGFGKALLAFHQEHNKKYRSYNGDEGLTKREIKKLLNKK